MNLIILPGGLIAIGLIIIVFLLACCALMAAGAYQIVQFQGDIKAMRKGEGYAGFRASFAGQPLPERILRVVYQTLSCDLAFVRALPVRASDSLKDVYGIDGFSGVETTELVEMIASRCRLQVDTLAQAPSPPILETVADLVALLGRAADTQGAPIYRATPMDRLDEALVTLRQAPFH